MGSVPDHLRRGDPGRHLARRCQAIVEVRRQLEMLTNAEVVVCHQTLEGDGRINTAIVVQDVDHPARVPEVERNEAGVAGITHQVANDQTVLRHLPNPEVAAPNDGGHRLQVLEVRQVVRPDLLFEVSEQVVRSQLESHGMLRVGG